MEKVLLLNASYEPLNFCSTKRAITLLMKGKAEQIEYTNTLINNSIKAPAVIRMLYYVVVPYKELPFNRKNIFHRDGYTCQYCGKKGLPLTLDHVIPKSRGGKNTWENIVAACPRCNTVKANRTPKEAGMTLLKQPRQPHNYIRFELTKNTVSPNENWEKYIAS